MNCPKLRALWKERKRGMPWAVTPQLSKSDVKAGISKRSPLGSLRRIAAV
jgi:hypothetical protein